MAIVLRNGIVGLVQGVREYLHLQGKDDVSVRLGWRERARQNNQGSPEANRIIFQPSDPTGKGGKFSGPMGPGPRPIKDGETLVATVRALASHDATLTVFCWAHDKAFPNDEGAQIEATWDLMQWAVRAIHATALADVTWGGDFSWTVSPVEKLFGKELSFTFAIKLPILDVPQEVTFPGPAIERDPPLDPDDP